MPTWVVIICATAIAAGTYSGGWRIIKTLGTKVVEVRPPQGFGSEAIAATVILASSHVGYPLSTTQVVSGAVCGSGVGRPGAQVNWKVARNIVAGWLLTLPAAAATSALVFAIIELLGGGAFGAIVACRPAGDRLLPPLAGEPPQPLRPLGNGLREPGLRPRVRKGQGRAARRRMIPFAEIVEVKPLLEAIWTSVVFGLFVLIVAGIGVQRLAARRRPARRTPRGELRLLGRRDDRLRRPPASPPWSSASGR